MHVELDRNHRAPAPLKPDRRPEAIIFLVLWFALMTVGRSQLFRDPGTLWHVVVGERILASRLLPWTDSFSCTCAGKPWIAQQWLGEVILAIVHKMCGIDGLLLVTATALACLYSWAASRLIRAGFHWLLASLIVSMAIAASSYHFHPRPHLITLVLLGITFALLCDFEVGRLPLRRLFWLVPLYVVWANVHGGMVGGIVTIALFSIGRFLFRRGEIDQSSRGRESGALISLVVLCGLTALVNPYGLALPRTWFALLTSPVLPRLIDEHRPLFTQQTGLMVFSLAGLYLAVWLGTLCQRPQITGLIPLFWLAMAFSRIRNGPLFAITAVIALADLFPKSCWAVWLTRRGSDLFQPPASARLQGQERVRFDPRPALIPLVLVLAALGLQVAGVRVPVLGRGWATLDRGDWPVDLLPELKAYERSRPDRTPIFNEMLFGGFLIYHTPGLRVFIDDRCELYGDEGLMCYANALEHDPGQLDLWANAYGFELALTQTGSGFDRYLQTAPGWTLVRATAPASLYRRKG